MKRIRKQTVCVIVIEKARHTGEIRYGGLVLDYRIYELEISGISEVSEVSEISEISTRYALQTSVRYGSAGGCADADCRCGTGYGRLPENG